MSSTRTNDPTRPHPRVGDPDTPGGEHALERWIDEHYRPAPLTRRREAEILAAVEQRRPARRVPALVGAAAGLACAIVLGLQLSTNSPAPTAPWVSTSTLDGLLIPSEAYASDDGWSDAFADDMLPPDYLAIEETLLAW